MKLCSTCKQRTRYRNQYQCRECRNEDKRRARVRLREELAELRAFRDEWLGRVEANKDKKPVRRRRRRWNLAAAASGPRST